jgi:hypothetical protein
VELDDPLPKGIDLLDPVQEIAKNVPGPLSPVGYQHDGQPGFLLGVVNPVTMKRHLRAPFIQPPPATGTPRGPNLSIQLEALVRALRDAELLTVGSIPAACIRNRFSVP